MHASAYFGIVTFVALCARAGFAADNETTSTYNRNVNQSQESYSKPSRECFRVVISRPWHQKLLALCGDDLDVQVLAQLSSSINCKNVGTCKMVYVGTCPCQNADVCKRNSTFESTACPSNSMFKSVHISNEKTKLTTSDAAKLYSTGDSIYEDYDPLSDNDQPDDFETLPITTASRATSNTTSVALKFHSNPMTRQNRRKATSSNETDLLGSRKAEIASTPIQKAFVTETSALSPCYSYSTTTTTDVSSSTECEKSRTTAASTDSVATSKLLQSTSDTIVRETSSTHSSETKSSLKGTNLSQSTTPLLGSATTTSTRNAKASTNYDRSENTSVSKSLTTSIISQAHDGPTSLPINNSTSPLPTSKEPKVEKKLDASATRRSSLTAQTNRTSAENDTPSKQSTILSIPTGPVHTPKLSSRFRKIEGQTTSLSPQSKFGDSTHFSTISSSVQQVVLETTTPSISPHSSFGRMSEETMANAGKSDRMSTSRATTSTESLALQSSEGTTYKIFSFIPSRLTRTVKHTEPLSSTSVNGLSSAFSTKIASIKSTPLSVMSTLRISPQKPLISESPAPHLTTTTWYQLEEKKSSSTDCRFDGIYGYGSTSAGSSLPLVLNASSSHAMITDSQSNSSTTEGAAEMTSSKDTSPALALTTRHFKDTSGNVVNSDYILSSLATSTYTMNEEPASTYTTYTNTEASEGSMTESTKLQSSSRAITTSFSTEPFEEVTESEFAAVATTTKNRVADTSIAHSTSLGTTHSTSAANPETTSSYSSTAESYDAGTSQAVSTIVQDETDMKIGAHSISSKNQTLSISNLHAMTTPPSTISTLKTVQSTTTRAESDSTTSLPIVSNPLRSTVRKEEISFVSLSTIYLPTNRSSSAVDDSSTQKSTVPVTDTQISSTSADDNESSQHEELHKYERSSRKAAQSPTILKITTFDVQMTTKLEQNFLEIYPEQSTFSTNESSREISSIRRLTTANIVTEGSTSKEKDKNETAAWNTATITKASTTETLSNTTVLLGSSTTSATKRLPSISISATTRSEYKNSDIVHRDDDNSFPTTQKMSTRETLVDATPSTSIENTTSATQTSQYWHELLPKKETTGFPISRLPLEITSFKYSSFFITWPLRQTTMSSEWKSDMYNKSAAFTDSHATSSSFEESQSTVEQSRYEEILPGDKHTALKQWTTSTKATTSTLQECRSACSANYQEGPYFCYRILSAKESTTYRRALKSCQDEDGELADEVDFRNAEVIETLEQTASENNAASANIYVNERDSELITKRKQVRLITLKGTTRFFLNVVGFAGTNEVLTENCGDVHCHLNDYDTLGVSSYLIMPKIRSEMFIGEKLQIPCAKTKSSVEVTCGEKGALEPQEISSICGEDQNSSSIDWEAETSLISAELKSCSDCHVLGTNNCESVNGSYSCVCKPEWSGHTCWKSPDQCRLKDVQCGANGTCISAIDKAYCECDEGFSGEHCNVLNPQLSFFSKTKSSILSAANAGVLVVSAGEILVMIVKGLMKLHFPKSGEDTQVFCQNMRSLLLSLAGFIVLFFHHPALFNINAFACGAWLYLETTCYSLSISFFTLESQNVHEVVFGNARKSHFWDKENKIPYEAPPVAISAVGIGLILGISIAMTMAGQMSKLVTSWSCMGHFSQQTLNIWLPIIIFNTCAALTATSFAYKSYFILTKIPQYRHKTNVNLETKELDVKFCIEKCYRNVAFVAFGPWLLLATWITLALSFDWVTVGSINLYAILIAMIVSFVYTACNFLQSAFTNPNSYSKYVRLAMKFCPKTIAPQMDPVTMWTRDEVLKMGNAKNFVPSSTRDRLRIQWMQMYANTKIEQSCSKSEALYSVYINEMGNRANGANLEQAEQIRHLNQEWVAQTYRKDPQPDPARRTKYEAELDRLTRNLCDAWNGTQALKKTKLRSTYEHNEFLIALKNYVEVNKYDPFEYCPLTMVDGQGNTRAMKCLKKPTEIIESAVLDRIQCQSRANIDDAHKCNERNHGHQHFDPHWLLMNDQEKRLKRLQDYENDVWNMAKQNYDYMSRVKAL